jgi:hypothetical protein
MNLKIVLGGVGLVIAGLGAYGLNLSYSRANDLGVAICMGVFFFGIQVFYDGIKALIGINS